MPRAVGKLLTSLWVRAPCSTVSKISLATWLSIELKDSESTVDIQSMYPSWPISSKRDHFLTENYIIFLLEFTLQDKVFDKKIILKQKNNKH